MLYIGCRHHVTSCLLFVSESVHCHVVASCDVVQKYGMNTNSDNMLDKARTLFKGWCYLHAVMRAITITKLNTIYIYIYNYEALLQTLHNNSGVNALAALSILKCIIEFSFEALRLGYH